MSSTRRWTICAIGAVLNALVFTQVLYPHPPLLINIIEGGAFGFLYGLLVFKN